MCGDDFNMPIEKLKRIFKQHVPDKIYSEKFQPIAQLSN